MGGSGFLMGFVVLAFIFAPTTAIAGENVDLEDFAYQDWSRPKFGDPLPIGGPVIRVYSEGGDRFDFVRKGHGQGLDTSRAPTRRGMTASHLQHIESNGLD